MAQVVFLGDSRCSAGSWDNRISRRVFTNSGISNLINNYVGSQKQELQDDLRELKEQCNALESEIKKELKTARV